MRKLRKGFTLIELLIVIAIIGILASIILINITSARAKSRDSSFKNTVRSINSAGLMCCNADGALQGKALGGGGSVEICNPSMGVAYPDDDVIGSVVVSSQCNNGGFTLTVTPGTGNIGNCIDSIVNNTGIVSYNGC